MTIGWSYKNLDESKGGVQPVTGINKLRSPLMHNKPANKPLIDHFEDILSETEKTGGQSYLFSLANIVDAEIEFYEKMIQAMKRELQNWPTKPVDLAANLRTALPLFEAELESIKRFRAQLRDRHGV